MILDLYMSWRLFGKLIYSTWCVSISCNSHDLIRGTGIRRFMVQLPYTLHIHSIHSTFQADGKRFKKLFYYIYFLLKVLFYIKIFN